MDKDNVDGDEDKGNGGTRKCNAASNSNDSTTLLEAVIKKEQERA